MRAFVFTPGLTLQVLAEMEEIIRYKEEGPVEQTRVRRMWLDRIAGTEPEPAVWLPLLKVSIANIYIRVCVCMGCMSV